MQPNARILLCVCAFALGSYGAHAKLRMESNKMQSHPRGLTFRKETPVNTLIWSQYSDYPIQSPELWCTSPGAPEDTVTDAGFNISAGSAHANPPLTCSAKQDGPNGYGLMKFTAAVSIGESVVANFTYGLEVNQVWHASTPTTSGSFPEQLYFNMNFEPTWSTRYSYMVESHHNMFGIMKDLRVAYGPDGWWIGSNTCETYADQNNGGALSFKCDFYLYTGEGDRYKADKKLRLTTGIDSNHLNFTVVDAF